MTTVRFLVPCRVLAGIPELSMSSSSLRRSRFAVSFETPSIVPHALLPVLVLSADFFPYAGRGFGLGPGCRMGWLVMMRFARTTSEPWASRPLNRFLNGDQRAIAGTLKVRIYQDLTQLWGLYRPHQNRQPMPVRDLSRCVTLDCL